MVQPRFAKALPTPRPLVQVRFDESLSLLRILRRVIPCGGPAYRGLLLPAGSTIILAVALYWLADRL